MDHDLRWPDVAADSSPIEEQVATRQGTWGKTLLRELFETILPALLIALAVNVFMAQPTRVDGTSMEPTLHNEERLVIEKISFRFHAPTRGDIIVFKLPGREHDPLIKRVVGVAGDVIAIRNGKVYIDGAELKEPYLDQLTPGYVSAQYVPPGYIFVLGDNRGASNDSRIFGLVPQEDLVGRAWVSYWPLETLGLLH
ncbi:MAG: signal peptidase I [Ardenticatenaceae bacterium]|nr:signal peptidase I [Ardenticatenaceae bacterium]